MDRGKHRGGSARGRGSGTGQRDAKAAILDLAQYVDKRLRVKFSGGRQVVGTLKGYDQLLNLVMDDVEEQLEGQEKLRSLGLVVLRGTALIVINPVDGFEEIANPFAQA